VERVLAIETSVPESSVSLWSGQVCLYSTDFLNGRNHNAKIFEVLQNVTECLEGEVLSQILVGTGPGSYSGVRVGIASAQGFAAVHHCPVVGIGSLSATSVAQGDTPSIAVGDARRGLYYISKIVNGEAAEPVLMEAAEFQGELEKAMAEQTQVFSLDDPAGLDITSEIKNGITQAKPTSALIANVWSKLNENRKAELLAAIVEPVYLRPPFTSKAKSGHPLLRK